MAPRWKYENWRITHRFTCPGSTRYGHKHRRNKKGSHRLLDTSNPISTSTTHPNTKYKVINVATLCGFMLYHHIYHQNRINHHFWLSFALLLYILMVSFKTNISHMFSLPTRWSLDSSFDTCGLRHLSCVIKTIKRGLIPMYMADPSTPTLPEDPDWLLERRKKFAEKMRLRRANAKVKKDPIPGRVRTRKCRERQRKQRITPVESINTNETVYVPSAIFESHSVLP